jgi:NAD(P)-dependent dehydrogenase (short-subunit alcohol dehydrogenase family)
MFSADALKNKRILVTGASAGIGKDTSILLSRLGARLILLGRNEDRLKVVVSQLSGEGHKTLSCDLSKENDFKKILQGFADDEKLSGLVSCAGIDATIPLKALSLKKWDEVLRLNLTAGMLLAQAFANSRVCKPESSIVFVGSVMSLVAQSGSSAYCASKAALSGLTKSLSLEFARDRIRVNLVCPGMVKTEMLAELGNRIGDEKMKAFELMHPLGFGETSDVAHAITYLLSDASRWVTGSNLVVDGGYTVS